MEIPFIVKLVMANTIVSSLFVIAISFAVTREWVRQTEWYARRQRRSEIAKMIEFGDELLDSLESYTDDSLTDVELREYLADVVVKYTYREYSDSQAAWDMEKLIWPDKFKNPHYVPYAMADISLPTLRLALLVLNNNAANADWKREVIRLAEISAFACVNKLRLELERT